MVKVEVRDNNLEAAMKVLKKKLRKEGIPGEMVKRKFYRKPSERNKHQKAISIRRAKTAEIKRVEKINGSK
jgi:small subunit ribosomal protein S21